jgi:O-glycosyl hydrolase
MKKLFLLLAFLIIFNYENKGFCINIPLFVISLDTNHVDYINIHLNEEQQTIENFGASDCWTTKFIGNWADEKKKNLIADYLFSTDTLDNGQPKGIGLSLWRFNIGSGSYEQGKASNIQDEYRREECFLDAKGNYNWNKQKGQQWFLNAAKNRGLNNFLAFSITPPVQFTIDGKAHGINANFNLQKGKENAYADFMVNVVKHFNKAGFHMPYLSPFNEPQWNWGQDKSTQEGTAATNTEISNFIRILGPKLNNTEVKIALGEAAQWNFLSDNFNNRGNQIKEFFSTNSKNYIGNVPNMENLLSAHSYFTTCPDTSLIKYRENVMKARKTFAPNLKLWQSEFGIIGNICGVYNGGPKNTSIDYGLYVAKVIHHDLSITNVSAWQWWLAVSPYNYSDALVYINDVNGGYDLEAIKTDGIVSDSKQLWCLGNYSRFVTPGMIRVKASLSSISDIADAANSQMITAYKDVANKKIVMVIINMESNSKSFAINPSLLLNKTFITYTTSANKNLEKSYSDANNIIIPSKSVITLIGDYK